MQINRRSISSTLLAIMLVMHAGSVAAHTVELGPNGGPMVEVKNHHLELVTKGEDLIVVISDASHVPMASLGASGRVVILESSAQRTVALSASPPDKLTAKLDKPIVTGARVVVSAKLADGQELLARFVVK